jgi:hypothetical protein
MALRPENPVVGGEVLRRAAIQSPNYVTGVSGWTINQDGSAEFNNLTIRGTFFGINFIVNSTGAFFYSSAPTLGNLSVSVVPGTVAVLDPEGNTAQPGVVTYGGGGLYSQLMAGILSFLFPGASTPGVVDMGGAGNLVLNSGNATGGDTAGQISIESASASGVTGGEILLQAGELSFNGTNVQMGAVTTLNLNVATIGIASGNINLNMARPPNYAAVVAGTATAAQVEACLGGLLTSLTNRKLMA